MKKYIQKTFLICAYVFMIAVFTDFRIKELIDWKELFLVIVGAIILTLPYITEQKKKVELLEIVGNNSLFSSYIVALVLILGRAGEIKPDETMLKEILLSLRPILYGLITMVLLKETESKHEVYKRKVKEQKEIKPLLEKEILEQIGEVEQTEDKQFQNKTIECAIIVDEKRKETKITQKQYDNLGLTTREIEIVKLVLGGLSNREIGEQLYIAESTVKKHMSNIFEKLGVKNREQLKQMFK